MGHSTAENMLESVGKKLGKTFCGAPSADASRQCVWGSVMSVGEEIVRQSSGVLTEVYKDAAQPSLRAIGTTVSLLPRTIRLWFGKWEKWVVNGEESLEKTAEAIRKKVAKTPEERLCEPAAYVALPAIQQISYSYDSDELRNMYANLLATSMDTAVKDNVHPSFVELIKQLSPDEARLLSVLPRSTSDNEPVVDLRIKLKGDEGYNNVVRNYTLVGKDVCEHPEQVPRYLDNLCRLKIIDIPDGIRLAQEEAYDPLIESVELDSIKASVVLPEGARFDIDKKTLHVTNFGLAFIQCCVDDYSPC